MARCDTYYQGECTWYVCTQEPWIPEGLGNAGDWLAAARRDGLATGSEPRAGAVVVYAAGDGYSDFGHVAVVRAVHPDGTFEVAEMNFTAWDAVDYRTSTAYDVAGFIYPPDGYVPAGGGANVGGPGGDPGQVAAAWDGFMTMLGGVLPAYHDYFQAVRADAARIGR